MTTTIEQQILDALATETSGIILSNKLFAPGGLFSRLAATEAERRVVSQSPLFRQAQSRVRELEYKEAETFFRAVEQVQASLPNGTYRFKMERSEVVEGSDFK